MEGTPKNYENDERGQTAGAEVLAEMPSFSEHMKTMDSDADAEKVAPLGEKYYHQAEEAREKWLAEGQEKIARTKELKPEDTNLQIMLNPDEVLRYPYREPVYGKLDMTVEEDREAFERYKEAKVQDAEEELEKDRNADLDTVARCFKNKEMIDQIATKLDSGEDFTDEEVEFLGEAPDSDSAAIDFGRFMTPDVYHVAQHHLMAIPSYRSLLDPKEEGYPDYAVVARAQMRELAKQNKVLLHENEEVRGALEMMEGRGADDGFAGETNVDRTTGEERTFTLEDNYPKLDGESDTDYANRLRRIQLKTRWAEKR